MTHRQYPLVSVITVNYNQAEVTMEWLHSIEQISYPNYEVIIVDNASADNKLEIYLMDYPNVKLVKSAVNRGFAGGNNLGIEKAIGELLLLLNNDTEVEAGFLEPLVAFMQDNPQAGIISPKIKYFHQPDIIQYAGGYNINPLTGRGKFIGSGKPDSGQFNSTHATGLIHGAAMLFSRQLIRQAGLMEESFFLYYEELDWGERAKRAGYTLYMVGQSVVYHKESVSVGKNTPLRMYYTTRNRTLFMKRNFPQAAFILYILFFTCVSTPKNITGLLAKREWQLLKAFLKGAFDGFVATTKKTFPLNGPLPVLTKTT
jgi:GT2 family glycosyltransferase